MDIMKAETGSSAALARRVDADVCERQADYFELRAPSEHQCSSRPRQLACAWKCRPVFTGRTPLVESFLRAMPHSFELLPSVSLGLPSLALL